MNHKKTVPLVLLALLLIPVASAQTADPVPGPVDRVVEVITVGVPQMMLQSLYISAPSTVQEGETFEAAVSSTNTEQDPTTYSADPCYGNSGVDTGRDPAVTLESSLSLVSKGDWNFVGGVIGYEFPITVEAVDADDTAVIGFDVYCNDGTTDRESVFITIESVETSASLSLTLNRVILSIQNMLGVL